MDLLLVLEHHFYKDSDGNVWCDRVVNREFIERYLQVFDNVTICARINNIETSQSKYHKVNGEKTEFLSLPDFVGFKGLFINIPKIIKIFSSNYANFDSVIFRAPSPLSLLLYRLCIDKIKVGVEFVMGADKFFDENRMINKILNKVIVKEAKRLCLKANAVSYVTSKHLQKTYPSYSIKYAPDARHYDSFYSSVDLQDYNYFEKKWSINDKPKLFNIVHIGYMDSDRKGHELLIYAAEKIINLGINIQVTFVGDGTNMNKFIELTKEIGMEDKIIFYGAINDKEKIAEILKNSHLLVLPSKSEGLPRVIIEAMAASTPCIASGVDGIPELLNQNYIVENFSAEEYANTIIKLINDWGEMINISRVNYNKSKEFHKDVLNKRRNQFYLNLKEMEFGTKSNKGLSIINQMQKKVRT